jgi:hypothetical protein
VVASTKHVSPRLKTYGRDGTAIAISDGSHKHDWVTARRSLSISRSELGGICAMLVAITLICEFFDVSQGSVEIGSNCESALYYIFTKDQCISATTNSFDIIMASSPTHASTYPGTPEYHAPGN